MSSSTTPDFLLPQPSAEGVAEFMDYYSRAYGKVISEGEAREALASLITILYQTALIEEAHA